MGFDLYPSFIALMQFGDRWLADGKPAPLTLVHISCGCDSHPLVACSHCGEGVNARDVKYRDGPGAGRHPAKAGRNTRRASDGSRFLLGRPSSVSRALQIIGDKWSFMVVREGVLRQSALRQDPDRAFDRAEHPDRSAVPPRRERRVPPAGNIRVRPTATNISSPTWGATSTVPSSRCCDGATAGFPKESLLCCSSISLADTIFTLRSFATVASSRSSPPTCVTDWPTIPSPSEPSGPRSVT